VVDEAGPFVAYVVNQATGRTYEAVRGRGARRDGAAITPSSATHLSGSIIGLSGFPGRHLGWMQYRVLGAIALDLCAVADGSLDGYLDCARSNHGVWDYLAGLLVCREAGAYVGETAGRELVVRTLEERRSPVAAGTEELLRELVAAHGGGAAE
jgi:fructose-1,6-bisphosphatase/inositol monophosphatase family enzyme